MRKEYRLDLHTHSSISYDGGITDEQFGRILDADPSLVIAITDHNEISFAQNLHAKYQDRIIVGEEILTLEGEIIGLYLSEIIKPGLSALETINQIRSQQGLVYIPHPFEKTRSGLPLPALTEITGSIDIMEVFNARSREPWLAKKTVEFALKNNIAQASSSDAHGKAGFGTAFATLPAIPTRETFLTLLRNASLKKQRAPLWSLLDPARNKLKKKLKL